MQFGNLRITLIEKINYEVLVYINLHFYYLNAKNFRELINCKIKLNHSSTSTCFIDNNNILHQTTLLGRIPLSFLQCKKRDFLYAWYSLEIFEFFYQWHSWVWFMNEKFRTSHHCLVKGFKGSLQTDFSNLPTFWCWTKLPFPTTLYSHV